MPDFSASFAMTVVIGERYRGVVIKGPWWVSCASWLVRGGVLETSLWSRAEQFVGLDVRIELWGWLLNAARLLWAGLSRGLVSAWSDPGHAELFLATFNRPYVRILRHLAQPRVAEPEKRKGNSP